MGHVEKAVRHSMHEWGLERPEPQGCGSGIRV